MSPLARETGVGFALAPGSKYVDYWVQEFGDRASFDFTFQLPVAPPANPPDALLALAVPLRQSGFQPVV
jgi:hypothetical protein